MLASKAQKILNESYLHFDATYNLIQISFSYIFPFYFSLMQQHYNSLFTFKNACSNMLKHIDMYGYSVLYEAITCLSCLQTILCGPWIHTCLDGSTYLSVFAWIHYNRYVFQNIAQWLGIGIGSSNLWNIYYLSGS